MLKVLIILLIIVSLPYFFVPYNKYICENLGNARQYNFSTDGNFGNLVNQIQNLFTNAITGITDGVDAAVSVIEMPYNLGHDLARPNEPLPQNTPLYKVINKT